MSEEKSGNWKVKFGRRQVEIGVLVTFILFTVSVRESSFLKEKKYLLSPTSSRNGETTGGWWGFLLFFNNVILKLIPNYFKK